MIASRHGLGIRPITFAFDECLLDMMRVHECCETCLQFDGHCDRFDDVGIGFRQGFGFSRIRSYQVYHDPGCSIRLS